MYFLSQNKKKYTETKLRQNLYLLRPGIYLEFSLNRKSVTFIYKSPAKIPPIAAEVLQKKCKKTQLKTRE